MVSWVKPDYLFQFLDAYDFGSEGSEEIQEDNKAWSMPPVLGLIFRKDQWLQGWFILYARLYHHVYVPGDNTSCRGTKIQRSQTMELRKNFDELYDE